MQAEEFSPGTSVYNLACGCALQGRDLECREWLKKSQAHGELPSKQHLLDDPDLVNVRGQAWFQSFLADGEMQQSRLDFTP